MKMSIKVESTSVKAAEPEKDVADVQDNTEETTDEVVAETTDETAEETTDESIEETAEDKAEESKEKPKKQRGFKKKIAKFQVELSAKEQEIERLRSELAAKSQEAAKPVKDKPKLDDFDSQAEFLEALTDWKLQQVKEESKKEIEQEKQKTQAQLKAESYNAKLAKAKEELPDYDEVLEDFTDEHGDVEISGALTALLSDSQVGPKVLYELMKNKDEFDRLNSLSPLAAAKEFGKLEAKLTPEKKQELKTKTNAPAPLKSVHGKSAATKKDIHNPNLSQAEYEALRRAQIKASKGA